jgi:hypothetical protein
VKVTVPVNPLLGAIVIVDVPVLVAKIEAGVTAPAEIEKSGWAAEAAYVTLRAWLSVNPFEPRKLPVTVTKNPPVALDRQERVTEPLRATLVGAKMQASPVRFTALLKLIVPVRPLMAVTVIVEFPLPPILVIVTGFGLALIKKSPVTVTATVAVWVMEPAGEPPDAAITTVYVPGVAEVNVQDPGAVPPAAKVTEAHVAVRPVAGVIAVVKVTGPAKPQVVVHVGRVPTPPRLDRLKVEVPLPPVVIETGVPAEKVKSLRTTMMEPEAGTLWLIPPSEAVNAYENLIPLRETEVKLKGMLTVAPAATVAVATVVAVLLHAWPLIVRPVGPHRAVIVAVPESPPKLVIVPVPMAKWPVAKSTVDGLNVNE